MSLPPDGSAEAAPARVEACEVLARLRAGEPLLLVCAYDSPVAWSKLGLAGALPLAALEARLDGLEEEVVLYCRCPADRTAERAARRLQAEAGVRAGVLAGGYEAAVAAGLRPLRRGRAP
jgi:rhodanese-related sulfurtransferase